MRERAQLSLRSFLLYLLLIAAVADAKPSSNVTLVGSGITGESVVRVTVQLSMPDPILKFWLLTFRRKKPNSITPPFSVKSGLAVGKKFPLKKPSKSAAVNPLS